MQLIPSIVFPLVYRWVLPKKAQRLRHNSHLFRLAHANCQRNSFILHFNWSILCHESKVSQVRRVRSGWAWLGERRTTGLFNQPRRKVSFASSSPIPPFHSFRMKNFVAAAVLTSLLAPVSALVPAWGQCGRFHLHAKLSLISHRDP